jgi:hypothetical protein
MICPCCGNDVAAVQREIRLELPDSVLEVDPEDRKKRVGMDHPSFLQLDLKRFFVRALLPVRLTDGHEFHFGVWLEVPEPTCQTLWVNWEKPEYSQMRFGARLANSVPPWNDLLRGADCTAGVREQDKLPYVESSLHSELSRVLMTPWSRTECEELLDRVWGRRGA